MYIVYKFLDIFLKSGHVQKDPFQFVTDYGDAQTPVEIGLVERR